MNPFEKRFSFFDVLGMSIVLTVLLLGHWKMAIIVAIVFAASSDVIYHIGMSSQWKELADKGERINAIKKYRQLYKAPLKEAYEAVLKHEAKCK